MMKPDWRLWDALEEVSIWQAVALSLNLAPDALSMNQIMRANGYSGGRFEQFTDSVTTDEFEKRRRFLERRLAKEPIVGHFGQDGEELYIANKVTLQDVARLLTSLDFVVPCEFAALVNTAVCFSTASSAGSEQSHSPPATPSNQAVKPARGRMAQQEQIIEEALKKLGRSMGDIPRCKPGKDGLRSQVREIVRSNPVFQAETSFDKAYDRVLRLDKELANKRDYKRFCRISERMTDLPPIFESCTSPGRD
jgi:hypothetical protein